MTPQETQQIVDFIYAAKDGKPTERTFAAWHLVIGNYQFDVMREAAVMALADPDINYLEPKHLVAKAGKIRDRIEADKRRELALAPSTDYSGVAMPKCEHGIGKLYCAPCCHQAAINAGLIANKPYKKKILL